MSIRILIVIAAIVGFVLFAQMPVSRSLAAASQGASSAPAGHDHQTGKPMSMPDMQKMHETMIADMKAEQQKLDELVKKMNSAKGDARVDAIAAIVTQLVERHRAMGEHMNMMHQHMMKMGK
jgi:alanine-alpha-ketoisovalerate/valine-pyruvate aminotransferase